MRARRPGRRPEGRGQRYAEPRTHAVPADRLRAVRHSGVSARPQVIGTVADHLEVPWGIAFLPDGSALVTERDSGRVLQITGHRITEVGRVDALARSGGESGLLGVAVSPSYAGTTGSSSTPPPTSDNRVLRTTLRNGRLGALDADPHRHPQEPDPRRRAG